MKLSIFGKDLEIPTDWSIGGNYSNAVLVAPVVVIVTGVAFTYVQERRRLRTLRSCKREQCKSALEKLEKQVTTSSIQQDKLDSILSLSLQQLLDALAQKTYTSEEVLIAYQTKALEVHKQTNCLIEPLWEAISLAKECDADDSKSKGLLHGIPISVKDNYGIEGYDSTIGCAKFINKPCTEDAVILQVLKKQGAIPFVKTNIPQTMISYETTNPIFGATVHPLDSKRGVGGSSGGEGALISSGGSLLGFGSDIGGSIRIPSHMCGICGIKPTCGRLSSKGTHPFYKGEKLVPGAYGPMAQDVDSLILAMKALLVPYMYELDSKVVPLPFRNEIFESKKKLRIGYYKSYDDFFHATPVCVRAVNEAKAALEKMGYELVPWNYPKFGSTVSRFYALAMMGDGGVEMKNTLKNDIYSDAIYRNVQIVNINNRIKKLIAFLLNPFMPGMANSLRSLAECNTIHDWWTVTAELENFKQEIEENWKRNEFDAMLCPGFGVTATTLGTAGKVPAAASYTYAYNVLDFPAGSVPVTKVTDGDEKELDNYKTPDLWHYFTKKAAKGSVGLPANVQIVTLPWQEELCLRVMKDLETSLKQNL